MAERQYFLQVRVNQLGAERLGDEPSFVGHPARFGLGVSRGDNDRDMWPRTSNAARQCEPIKLTRHLHVGEQQDDLWMTHFQQLECRIALLGIQHLKASVLEDFDDIHTDEEIIIYDECKWSVRGR